MKNLARVILVFSFVSIHATRKKIIKDYYNRTRCTTPFPLSKKECLEQVLQDRLEMQRAK